MQMRSRSLLLMIVSIAIADLPVWRSPMISSRWPRPIAVMESIAFRPVYMGSSTGLRWTTPGALNSAGRVWVVSMSPLPSSGCPSGVTMRPSSCSPTGISSRRLVRLTVSPSTIWSQAPNRTAPTLSDSRLSARPVTSCGNSSSSSDRQFSRPWRRAMPSLTLRTVPTSVRSASPTSRPSMRCLRIEVISSGLICIKVLGRWALGALGPGQLASHLFEAVPDTGIEDAVAHSEDDAAEDLGVDLGGQLDPAVGLLGDAAGDLLHGLVVELDCACHLDREEAVLLLPAFLELAADPEQGRHAVLLDQQVEEVLKRRVGAVEHLVQALFLLHRREVGREQEHLQVAVVVERVGDLSELVPDGIELVLLLGHLEQRPRVDLGNLLHLVVPPASPLCDWQDPGAAWQGRRIEGIPCILRDSRTQPGGHPGPPGVPRVCRKCH